MRLSEHPVPGVVVSAVAVSVAVAVAVARKAKTKMRKGGLAILSTGALLLLVDARQSQNILNRQEEGGGCMLFTV